MDEKDYLKQDLERYTELEEAGLIEVFFKKNLKAFLKLAKVGDILHTLKLDEDNNILSHGDYIIINTIKGLFQVYDIRKNRLDTYSSIENFDAQYCVVRFSRGQINMDVEKDFILRRDID